MKDEKLVYVDTDVAKEEVKKTEDSKLETEENAKDTEVEKDENEKKDE